MIISIDYKKCTGCEACIEICPVNIIYRDDDKVKIDNSRCIKCRTCVVTCPYKAINIK